jgi:hypothetical protein
MNSKTFLFICVGIIIVLADCFWLIKISKFISTASSAQGVVVRLNAGGSHPQVKFTTKEGREISYPQNGLVFGYKSGDKVKVMYNSQHPQNAEIDTFGALWGFPVLLFILGVSFIGTALLHNYRPDLVG